MNAVVARPVTLPNRVGQRVTVRTMNDFPAPVAGVITLEPDTQYNIVGIGLTTADRFECTGSVSVTGLWTLGDLANPQLTYTGSGTMFTVNEGSFDISNILLSCPNGTFLDMSSPTALAGFKFSNTFIVACQKLGTLQDIVTIDAADNGAFQMADGWTIDMSGPIATISFRQFNFGQMANGAVAIDLQTSVLQTVELRDCLFNPAPAAAVTGISGLPNSGNIAPGNFASVASCEFQVGTTPLVGLTTDDVRWNFNDNVGLQNTSQRALNNIQDNAVLTDLVENTAVAAEGTWTLVNNSQFQQGAADTSQIQYIGERPLQFALDATITLLGDTATPLVQVDFYLNGSPVSGATTKIEVSTATNLTGTIVWLGELVQNDILEIFLTNLDDSTDVTLTDGTVRLVALS